MLENLSRSGSICKERKELTFRVKALIKSQSDSKHQLFSLLTDAASPAEIFQRFSTFGNKFIMLSIVLHFPPYLGFSALVLGLAADQSVVMSGFLTVFKQL